MRYSQTNRQRAGYTLIELLVVIGIITLLLGLLFPAVQKFRARGTELEVRHEIGQIETAIDGFKSTYQVSYLPSVFVLAYNYNSPNHPGMVDSRQYYARVWPKAFLTPGTAPDNVPSAGYTRTPQGTLVTLDGNQALLFFLGGISPPTQNGSNPNGFTNSWQGNRTGFLNNPSNPFNRNAAGNLCGGNLSGETAKGPFYTFNPKRIDANGHYHDHHWLKDDPNSLNSNIYYYFSSKEGNDYHYFRLYSSLIPTYDANTGGYGGMHPFVGPDGKYLNPSTCQIISSGRDHIGGPGGTYPSGFYADSNAPGGGDDQANFKNNLLGGR